MRFNIRSRWGYACSAAIVAGVITVLHYVLGLKYYSFESLLAWTSYAMACAALLAMLFWPRKNAVSRKRMLVSGICIPVIVISIISLTFSILNPGFPDAMVDGIETNIYRILDTGSFMFAYFSIMTLGAPFIAGPFLSVLFAKSDEP